VPEQPAPIFIGAPTPGIKQKATSVRLSNPSYGLLESREVRQQKKARRHVLTLIGSWNSLQCQKQTVFSNIKQQEPRRFQSKTSPSPTGPTRGPTSNLRPPTARRAPRPAWEASAPRPEMITPGWRKTAQLRKSVSSAKSNVRWTSLCSRVGDLMRVCLKRG
jgi:hypothetical protein